MSEDKSRESTIVAALGNLDRAATASIRGYYTQMVYSAFLWLSLPDNEALVLEGREDVDRFVFSASGDLEDEQRRQLKDAAGSLNVRSKEVWESVFNFARGYSAHASQSKCGYVFVTTASKRGQNVAKTTGLRQSDRGVELDLEVDVVATWQQLADSKDCDGDVGRIARGIWGVFERHLRPVLDAPAGEVTEPARASATAVEQALKWLDANGWRPFLEAVTWEFDVDGPTDLRSKLAGEIATRGVAAPLPAEVVASLLIHEVFTLGYQDDPADRILTAEGLHILIASFSEVDPSHAAALHSRLADLESILYHLVNLQESVEQLHAGQAQLQDQIRKLASETDVVPFRVTSLTPPPLPAKLARRPEATGEVLAAMERSALVIIAGEAGYGKSNLASLAVEESGRACRWLNLYGSTSVDMRWALEEFARALGAEATTRNDLFRQALGSVSGSLIVLDDMPSLARRVAAELALFAVVASEFDVTVLVTASALPSPKLEELLGDQVTVFGNLDFTNAEVQELFIAHGAPETLPEKFVDATATLSGRCATLVKACATFLEGIQWNLKSSGAIDGLLGQGFAASTKADTMNRLLETVSDEPTRSFLYRLSVPSGLVSAELATKLAEIEPAISHPGEKLIELDGAWLRSEADGQMRVSPLLYGIAETNLRSDILRGVHQTCADYLLRTGTVEHHQATMAVAYLTRAGDFDRAGRLYLSQLEHLSDYEGLTEDQLPLLPWISVELPEAMARPLRLAIRIQQLQVLPRIGISVDEVVGHLQRLLAASRPDDLPFLILLKLHDVLGLVPFDFDDVFYALVDEHLANTDHKLPEEVAPALAVALIEDIETGADLARWLECVKRFGLPNDEDSAVVHAVRLAIWRVGSELDRAVEELARNSPVPWIAAAVEANVALGKETATLSQDAAPECRFLVLSTLAFSASDENSALELFEEALGHDAGLFRSDLVWTLHGYAARLAKQSRWSEVLEVCAKAKEAAFAHGEPITVFYAIAEEAIAQYLAGEIERSIHGFAAALDALWEQKSRTTLEKRAFVMLGHVTGYVLSMLRFGKPPYEGSPFVGLFQEAKMEAAHFFREDKIPLLFDQISEMMDFIGADREVQRSWYGRTFDMGLEFGREELVFAAGIPVLADLLTSDPLKIDEVVDAAYRYGRAAAKVKIVAEQQIDFVEDPKAMRDLELDSEATAFADDSFYAAGLLPALMCVERRTLPELEVSARGHDFATVDELSHILRLADEGRVRELIRGSWSGWATQAFAGLLASLSRDVPHESALQAQLLCLYRQVPLLVKSDALLLDVIEPFLCAFWSERAMNARLGFNHPKTMLPRLQSALGAGPGERWRKVLRVVLSDLQPNLPPAIKAWL